MFSKILPNELDQPSSSFLNVFMSSLSTAIIFASYALHVQYRPFLEHNDDVTASSREFRRHSIAEVANAKLATSIYVSAAPCT